MRSFRKQPGNVKFGSNKKRAEGKTKYNNHEYELADKLGGTRQPASGALAHRKGDVVIDDGIFSANRYLFDSKESEGSTIILTGKDITKICREASDENKHPGLLVKIGKMADTTPKEWVAIPIEVFAALLERIREYESESNA